MCYLSRTGVKYKFYWVNVEDVGDNGNFEKVICKD